MKREVKRGYNVGKHLEQLRGGWGGEKKKERLSGVSIPTLWLKHPCATLQTPPPPQTNNAEVAARGRRQSWQNILRNLPLSPCKRSWALDFDTSGDTLGFVLGFFSQFFQCTIDWSNCVEKFNDQKDHVKNNEQNCFQKKNKWEDRKVSKLAKLKASLSFRKIYGENY